MPTTVSTTPLTAAESQFLNECTAGKQIVLLTEQLARQQAQVTRTNTSLTAAQAALQKDMATVLASRSPAIPVPTGDMIVRQTVGGVDSLLVQSNP